MEVTAACAGGICFCGCNQRRGREVLEAVEAVVRVPVGFGPRKAARNSWVRVPVGFGLGPQGWR